MNPPPMLKSQLNDVDAEHLRLLSIFFKISGVITIVVVSIFILHFLIFSIIAALPSSTWESGEPPPRLIFAASAGVIGLIIFGGWLFGALTIYAGHCIKKRQHYWLIFTIACIKCIFIPYGTILAVCTFQVLSKPHLKLLFKSKS